MDVLVVLDCQLVAAVCLLVRLAGARTLGMTAQQGRPILMDPERAP